MTGEQHRPYGHELRVHARALFAASAGMAGGFLLNHYVASLFAPHLIDEFGWSRAEFAMIGSLGLISLFVVPVVGRLTDLFGVRPVATVGVIMFPLTFVAYSMMDGSILTFAAITVVQHLLAGATTSSTVYSRLVAERFTAARGLALAIAATSPAAIGVLFSPLLHAFIGAQGWRAGYLAVAVFVAAMGGLALLLIPRRPAAPSGEASHAAPRHRSARQDYATVMRQSRFWIICGGMLLCTLIYPLQSSQMKLMLHEMGASDDAAAWMISLFAAGVLIGRFGCGVALDRFPTHLVAAIALGLPGVALLTLASGMAPVSVLAASVMVMGLSLGAESDLAAFLVMRYFSMEVYGTVLGLVVASMAVAAALGAIVLSVTLAMVDNFRLYMLLAGVLTLAGATLFLMLLREPAVR